MLTIAKLKRWSINYYIDTAERASKDLARAGGGLGEYYSERETRTPTWLLAGDTHTVAALVGLTDAQRAGGDADAAAVARWLDGWWLYSLTRPPRPARAPARAPVHLWPPVPRPVA